VVRPIDVKEDEDVDTHQRHLVAAAKYQFHEKQLLVSHFAPHRFRLNRGVTVKDFPRVPLGLVLETRHREL
jgi:hypothetical protein